MKNKLFPLSISLFLIMNFSYNCYAQHWDGANNFTSTIKRSGQVGIGDASIDNISGLLQLSNSAGPVFKLANTGNPVNGTILGVILAGTTSSSFNPYTGPGIVFSSENTWKKGDQKYRIEFHTKDLGELARESMRITSNGRIGVGSQDPQAFLHIVAKETKGVFIDYNATKKFSYAFKIALTDPDIDNSNYTKVFAFSNPVVSLDDLFVIWGNGTVNAKSLYAEKIEVRTDAMGTSIPDYVFEDDYLLPSLNSIEEFIKINKHLPEVPSAKEFNLNGMDLVQMNTILLKKIEELTLYVISLQKQVDGLK